MSLRELLEELQKLGIRLIAAEDRLRYSPAEKVTPELRRQMAAHKGELLSLLRRSDEVHYALKERGVAGEPIIEPCLVGCGSLLRFFYFRSEGFGYCAQCDMHERILTTPA